MPKKNEIYKRACVDCSELFLSFSRTSKFCLIDKIKRTLNVWGRHSPKEEVNIILSNLEKLRIKNKEELYSIWIRKRHTFVIARIKCVERGFLELNIKGYVNFVLRK